MRSNDKKLYSFNIEHPDCTISAFVFQQSSHVIFRATRMRSALRSARKSTNVNAWLDTPAKEPKTNVKVREQLATCTRLEGCVMISAGDCQNNIIMAALNA